MLSLTGGFGPNAPTLSTKSVRPYGASVDLQSEDHAPLLAALRERCFFETADGGLRVNNANRGEPFRKGMDVSVGDDRVFLDDGYDLGDAIAFLDRHGPAVEADTPSL